MTAPPQASGGEAAFLAGLLEELLRILEPLQQALDDPHGIRELLRRHGWQTEVAGPDLGELRRLFGIGPELEALAERVRRLATAEADELLALVSEALPQVLAVGDSIRALTRLGQMALAAPFDRAEFWAEFPPALLEWLLVDHLERRRPLLFAPLLGLGLVDEEVVAPTAPGRLPYLRRRIAWERLELLARPEQLVRDVYGWGTDELAGNLVLDRLVRFATALGLPAGPRDARPWLVERYYPPGAGAVAEAYLPIARGDEAGQAADAGLAVLAVPARDGQLPGLVIAPTASGRALLAVGDLQLRLTAALGPDVQFELRPGSTRLTGGPAAAGQIEAQLAFNPRRPAVVLGSPRSYRLEVSAGRIGLTLSEAGGDLLIALDDGALVLAAGDGDSFLARLMGEEPIVVPVKILLRWDARKGLHFEGAAGLRVAIPIDEALGPVRFETVTVGLLGGTDGLEAGVGLTLAAALGPVFVRVEDVGARLILARPEQAGELKLRFGFKPPAGAGLAIESEIASGGGFLSFDEPSGQYTGVFELTIAETVSVKVVGLISTKLPGGKPGFALLIIITAEGFTPVQLGMGFSLTGIGGLLALNRTIEIDAVRGGLKNGVLDSVLFPKDPVRNAGRVISTLNRVFPQAPDRLVVGPMATISWGSPPIVNVRLAVLLELPDPLRIIVLASLAALLPDEDQPVLQLRVDAVGVLDFKRGELSLDASIYDSRILQFALTGDVALRLRWKHEPQFLLSVGGFHPRYAPPPGFPSLERVALTLSEGDNPRLRFDCYFALTSNSIQFGAHVELFAAAAGFELIGSGGFDALIQWSPFLFSVDVFARLGVRFAGATILAINLELGLVGPDPWRAHGVAEVEFLFIKARVSFELQIGADREPPPPEAIDAAGLVWRALTDRGNWAAALPESVRPGVTLVDGGSQGVLAHPLATVSVRQRVLPLDTPITRLGAYVLQGGPATYHADVRADDTTEGLVVEPLSDQFALGQFQARTDDQRLTERDFVARTAGYRVSTGGVDRIPEAHALDSRLSFETLLIGEQDEPVQPDEP